MKSKWELEFAKITNSKAKQTKTQKLYIHKIPHYPKPFSKSQQQLMEVGLRSKIPRGDADYAHVRTSIQYGDRVDEMTDSTLKKFEPWVAMYFRSFLKPAIQFALT
jgi:hypothetical protein